MISLYNIAKEDYSHDPVTKPLRYYEIFEQALHEEGLSPKFILEIGVYQGESTKALAKRFPAAHIVAVDLKLRDIDFSAYQNVHYLQCDQTDGAKLRSICEDYFPNGLDLVIEDASHIGHLSRLTFNFIFPHVSSGGLYIIEDWGTGYWDTWIDGGRFSDCKVPVAADRITRTIPSHNLGMVGFVKSLVDYTATDDIGSDRAVARTRLSRLGLAAGRVSALRKIVERIPRFKLWLTERLQLGGSAHIVAPPEGHAELPRLKSLKFFRGVCIACKA
ncbi:MAG: hypothetical protein Q8M11_22420 [Sulfuritalea sp.]|nr:hypothetical protein [Sulfuritalea sp.]